MRARTTLLVLATVMGISVPKAAWPQSSFGDIERVAISNGHIALTFESSAGHSYHVQRNDTLGTRWWADSGAPCVAADTVTPAEVESDLPCAFFQVLEFTNSVFGGQGKDELR